MEHQCKPQAFGEEVQRYEGCPESAQGEFRVLHHDVRNELMTGPVRGLSFDIRRSAFCDALKGTKMHQFMGLPDLLERGRYMRAHVEERQAEPKQENDDAPPYRELLFNDQAR